MAVPLAAGYALSATAVFATVWLVGAVVRRESSTAFRAATIVVLAGCCAADLVFPRIRCSLKRRQTPKDLVHRLPRELVGFVWGLDTGAVVSTYRASAASAAAIAVVAAGWAPVWAGAIYAAGFSLPLLAIVASQAGRADVETVVARVAAGVGKLRLASAGVIAATAAVALAQIT